LAWHYSEYVPVFLLLFRSRLPYRNASRIIPQALCARYGLRIGALFAPLVLALMYLLFPIAYPIAMLLDAALGAGEGHTYKKAELKVRCCVFKGRGN
jgi:metal transporter CNNM